MKQKCLKIRKEKLPRQADREIKILHETGHYLNKDDIKNPPQISLNYRHYLVIRISRNITSYRRTRNQF